MGSHHVSVHLRIAVVRIGTMMMMILMIVMIWNVDQSVNIIDLSYLV